MAAGMRRLLTAPPERFSRSPALPLLVWISISGTFAIHLFVPVLAFAAHDLHVLPGTVRFAITAYLVGLSAGQLALGPLSDRFGRRPVLIAGLLVYILGTVGVAIAPGIGTLIAARLVEAVGGCAGLVLGRAITRDTASDEMVTQRIAVLASAVSVGPALAPIIGIQLAFLFGWRGMFWVLAGVSALLFVVTMLTLPETHHQRSGADWRSYARSWVRLLTNGRFRRYCIGGAFATTSFYGFVANAPFILHDRFGFATDRVGVLYLLMVSCLTAGGVIASLIARRVRTETMVVASSGCMAVAASIALGLELTVGGGPVGYLLCVAAFLCSIGVCSPFAISGSVNVDPAAVGAAAGLYGSLQMAVGALLVVALGLIPAPPILASDAVMLGASLVGLFFFVGDGDRRRPGRWSG